MTLEPTTESELQDALRSCEFAVPVGRKTKPNLSRVPEIYQRISTRRLSGIVEYDPTEFTVTVRAGTPLQEIEKTLARHGQYLPFDPPLASAGATIGGTVAAGLSGPGAFRFGPIRDFLIGIRFIDGAGRCLSGGGKVVKNAAGFDLPKFLIGSLGRFAIITELTLKVFPRPAAVATFGIAPADLDHALTLQSQLSRGPYDLDALDYEPHAQVLWGRLSGNPSAVESRLRRLDRALDLQHPITICEKEEADYFWRRQLDYAWSDPDRALAKIPLVPDAIRSLEPWAIGKNIRRTFTMAGNLAWLSGSAKAIGRIEKFGLTALMIRDPEHPARLWRGRPPRPDPIFTRIKDAFDPDGRFPFLFESDASGLASDGPSPLGSRPDPNASDDEDEDD